MHPYRRLCRLLRAKPRRPALRPGAPPPFSSGEPRGTYPPPPNGGSYTVTGSAGGADYNFSGTIPPPPTPGAPNPGLAALLGLIPGVGAMYNGQYAKGIVHLIVFAILVSLSDEHGIFGLLIAGWMFYQVIEAHHTARARRDGTPLPNPFGLNDLGERLGFGKSWPTPPPPNTNFTPDPSASTPSGYTPPARATPRAKPRLERPLGRTSRPPISPVPPYSAPGYPFDPNLRDTRNRFPSGALWLIGLGVFFLIGNVGIFHHLPLDRLLPFFLIGIGVWLFVRKMTETGVSLTDDGSPGYQYRLFFALQSSVWVVLVGVLFLLDSFGIRAVAGLSSSSSPA